MKSLTEIASEVVGGWWRRSIRWKMRIFFFFLNDTERWEFEKWVIKVVEIIEIIYIHFTFNLVLMWSLLAKAPISGTSLTYYKRLSNKLHSQQSRKIINKKIFIVFFERLLKCVKPSPRKSIHIVKRKIIQNLYKTLYHNNVTMAFLWVFVFKKKKPDAQ